MSGMQTPPSPSPSPSPSTNMYTISPLLSSPFLSPASKRLHSTCTLQNSPEPSPARPSSTRSLARSIKQNRPRKTKSKNKTYTVR
ncbi:hypothetical protein CC80DRAFT_12357 [Byssothecium circinans]|uniref:Uncharacterized protein n=1 Tax=Byssothecium circinans TaxID=147558 RepID=A0A6A5UEV6_9PLEO|nr:hypothetical protein CC80DRAFT_12357 [Byssothecium circinans]